MLDIRAITTTPGAVLVLGNPGVIGGNDGAAVAGVPIKPTARLIDWGFLSPTADSIARLQLVSQDQPDPINGEDISPGAASLWLGFHKFTNIPYKTGNRIIKAGTNVGVVAGTAFTIDFYDHESDIGGDRAYFSPNIVMPPSFTYGAALVANTWGNNAFAPTTAIPNGKYAILGAWTTALSNVGAIRFQHADFGYCAPGFPVADPEISAILGLQIHNRDPLWLAQGYQFAYLSEKTGKNCIPTFTVSNAGTGLLVQMIAAQAATPVVTLNLAKVG